MDTESRILISFMGVVFLFFASAMHTDRFEAEKRIEQDFGIEAELNFEKDDNREMNIFEIHQKKIDDFPNAIYSIVK